MIADQPQALLWNPDGLPFEDAARMLGVRRGTVAILGSTKIFGLFLPRMTYFIFRTSQVCDCRSGEPYSLRCPSIVPKQSSH